MRTALPHLCFVFVFFFLNPEAEIMLNMLFNTLLTITPHNAKKEEKKEQRMDLHDDIRAKSPIQFLTPTDRA